jgi:pullulanase
MRNSFLLSIAMVSFLMATFQFNIMAQNSFKSSDFAAYPTYNGEDLGYSYDKNGNHFKLWSPKADSVKLKIYQHAQGGSPNISL